ncbi:hypothetical protein SAMD00019534_040420 [Acytostelium subglobosum LB1]|uniref:hypothetical protein n=1 Tax=Acytostelium subglobosum LB1 TaxID=1410327 RepID=UPI0006448931|nr:hypothetical protein SAMD00019534_040420 [Acytostelium subglobosum LB1]GAM20867.1 hypothetical protein SAMD00019534_040420 [Acytostelium subglobosum LB1]|eukprot:XP_012756001.1 hypothetical protein SAMD00019534_040420 [Acytostelium subglobosum LB1]
MSDEPMETGASSKDGDQKEKIYTSDLRKGILPSKFKGRGTTDSIDSERYAGQDGVFEPLSATESEIKPGTPIRSIEGWIIIVTNIHDEVQESDLRDVFCEYGAIRNLHLNYDRRTGFVKGYAMIEYENQSEADAAIKESGKLEIAGQKLSVDYAFVSTNDTSGPVLQLRSQRRGGSDRPRQQHRTLESYNRGGGGGRGRGGYDRDDRDNRRRY